MTDHAITREEILEKLRDVLDAQGVDRDKITETAYFNVEHSGEENLGLDSLDLVEMVMEFEDVFGIKISDEDSMKLKTVADAVDYLYGRRDELTITPPEPAAE